MSNEAELDQQLELILRAVGTSLKLYPMGMSIADIRQELKQAMLKAAPEQKWIKCSERLPEPEKPVLLRQWINQDKKHVWTVVATYIPRHSVEADFDSDDECDEYREEDDTYYLQEGWYERLVNWVDFGHIKISDGLEIEWMPLPQPPGEDA